MNRNHQSRNDQNRTKGGRHNVARTQLGRSMRTPMEYNPSEVRNTRYYTSPYHVNHEYAYNKSQREKPYQTSGFAKEDPYENYRSDGPGPIEIEVRDRYTHANDMNLTRDFHGRRMSYRAMAEMNEDNDENFIHSYRHLDSADTEEDQGMGQYGGESRYRGVGPKGYKRSDNVIEEEICETLVHTRGVNVENVLISVKDGVVRLSGSTNDRNTKFRIEDIAEEVYGVKEVQNDIKVERA